MYISASRQHTVDTAKLDRQLFFNMISTSKEQQNLAYYKTKPMMIPLLKKMVPVPQT